MKVLIQDLKQFYIPPLAKLYFERIALEKLVFRTPLFVRVSDPESWRVKDCYHQLKKLSAESLKVHLENLNAYLSLDQSGTIFEGNKILCLNESIPYIEWQSETGLSASSDLLGQHSLFIDLLEFENELDDLGEVIATLQSLFKERLKIVLIGPFESSFSLVQLYNIVAIDPDRTTNLSFAERFKFRNRNGLTLFNFGSRPYFLVNPQGKLSTFFTKQEKKELISELGEYITPSIES